jgi:hypothetical protein
VASDVVKQLPDFVDEELWFISPHCHERDYLYDSGWQTHRGRMSAWCPHDPNWRSYKISLSELPRDLPRATRWWVRGFLAGNVPDAPAALCDPAMSGTPELERWFELARRFSATGKWPAEDDVEAYLSGKRALPDLMNP